MIRFAADEDFDADIVRALRRRLPDLDIVRVQDVGLSGADDPTVLAWAASEARVLLTHDVSTMTQHALDRVALGQSMPGVIVIHQRLALGQAIEDLVLVAACSAAEEWARRVHYFRPPKEGALEILGASSQLEPAAKPRLSMAWKQTP